jgi:putative ABC transport system ATP-binding protein
MYELHKVSKRYERKGKQVSALDNVDLTIDEGEFLAIQGPTGSGKTTLLEVLGGLVRPTSGAVLCDGTDMARLSEARLGDLRRTMFGFVFQHFNLIPTLTAQENVELALVPTGVSPADRRRRALAALAGVGLDGRGDHLPSEMSGGEQQRTAIARALVRSPRVILADEPTGNLDEGTRDEIIELLLTLWRERGQTVIVVTHDSTVAGHASQRVWVEDGRIRLPDHESWQTETPRLAPVACV